MVAGELLLGRSWSFTWLAARPPRGGAGVVRMSLPSPVAVPADPGAFEFRQLDLRTCPAEDVSRVARAFAEGFFCRDGAGPPPSEDLAAALAADKALSIHTRFRTEEPLAATADDASNAERLPAAVVATCLDGRIVAFASVFGAIRVRDASGSRLLSGREAEAFLAASARASPEERMRTTTRRAALLCDVTVLPEARRRGLGQRLCAEAERVAGEWGYSDLLLLVNEDNAPARALYEKLGYRDGGTRCSSVEDRVEAGRRVQCTVSNILLGKSLGSRRRWRAPRGATNGGKAAEGGGGGGGSGPRFKLFARTRDEELRRKQLIGHIIPAVALLALAGAVSTSPVGAFWAPVGAVGGFGGGGW